MDSVALHAPLGRLPADVNLPSDIAGFICRRAECNHWAGEEPYDTDRAQQIEAATNTLKCDDIARDEKELRLRYRIDPEVLKALEATREKGL